MFEIQSKKSSCIKVHFNLAHFKTFQQKRDIFEDASEELQGYLYCALMIVVVAML
jgi:hypothetical protein